MTTDTELRAERVAAMGADLGNLYHELEGDLAWLLRKQREFGDLFGDDDSQTDLLNRVASNFFYFLERMFYEDALLHIGRLTDPAQTGGRAQQANLTIQALGGATTDPNLKMQVQAAVDAAVSASRFAREWRNKRLAHADLAMHRQGQASSLPEVRRGDIAAAAEAIAEPIKLVARHFGVPSALLNLSDPWGAKALVQYLRKAESTA